MIMSVKLGYRDIIDDMWLDFQQGKLSNEVAKQLLIWALQNYPQQVKEWLEHA
jgi:hypothetical protein